MKEARNTPRSPKLLKPSAKDIILHPFCVSTLYTERFDVFKNLGMQASVKPLWTANTDDKCGGK
jgi:hypothetical protein